MFRYGLWMIGIGATLWMLSSEAPPALGLPPGWCPMGDAEEDQADACPINGTCDNRVVRNQWIPGPGTSPMTIRVKFNVFCDDAGLDCAASLSDVNAQRDTLNIMFQVYGIQFVPAAPDSALVQFINDSRFRHFCEGLVPDACWKRSGSCRSSTFTEEYIMKSQYADNPAYQLNIYVTDTSNAGFTGLGFFPWCTDAAGTYGGIILNGGHVGGFSCGPTGSSLCRILVHEIAHNLGLWHTFHGVSEVSCISGCREGPECNGLDPQTGLCPFQYCDDVGDFCCDTPATPVNVTCGDPIDPDNCANVYSGTDPDNYMDAGGDGCWNHFSNQQAGRMHCWTCDAPYGLVGWFDGDTGSCCQGSACSVLAESCCVNNGGTFQGAGTDCIGDCDADGIADVCEGVEEDCNDNGVPDSCDIAGGTSEDCQPNGIPDDCENTCDPVGDCSADPDCCCVTNPFKPRCRPWDNVCVLCYDDSHCGANCCCKPNGTCSCGPFACGQYGPQGP